MSTPAKNLKEIRDKCTNNIYTLRSKISSPTQRKKYRSDVWNLFYEILDDKNTLINGVVACSRCNMVYCYDSSKTGTNQMKRHICCTITVNGTVDVPEISSFFSRADDKPISTADKSKVRNGCIKYCTKDLRPMEAVKGIGFTQLLSEFTRIGQQYGFLSEEAVKNLLPCPTTLSRNIRSTASKVRISLATTLEKHFREHGGSITLDLWKDDYKRHNYICLTAHYICENSHGLQLNDRIICTRALESVSTTNDIVLGEILRILREYSLFEHRFNIIFVTDRGGNVVLALNSFKRLNCFGHLINNIVKASLEVENRITDILPPLKKLVKYMKITGHNNDLNASLKSYVKTRFNSYYDLLESVLA